MSRSDQLFGLTGWAQTFVKGESELLYTEETTRFYPDGRRERQEPRKVYGSTVTREASGQVYCGMFDDEYPLYKYTFADGRVYYEAVQANPWSSGPCFFLALKNADGDWLPESLWPQKTIDEA